MPCSASRTQPVVSNLTRYFWNFMNFKAFYLKGLRAILYHCVGWVMVGVRRCNQIFIKTSLSRCEDIMQIIVGIVYCAGRVYLVLIGALF
jgi:glucose uptake protein GlcU